jgi:hypothetical protein
MQAANIHQRIAKVMQTITYIQKEKKQGMRYTIVSHDAVTAKVRGPLLDAGIHYYPKTVSHVQNGNRTQCEMVVRFVNIDDPSDYIDVETFGYGIDDQDKGPGKAMSYAVKYALLKCLGLETGDDPDLEQDVQHKQDVRPWSEIETMLSNASDLDLLKSIKVLLRDEAGYWPVDYRAKFNAAYAIRQQELSNV